MRTNKLWPIGVGVVVGLALGSGASRAQQDVCAGYDLKITRFGPNAISTNRSDSPAEFQRLFAEHREELEAILHSQGMGRDIESAVVGRVDTRGSAKLLLQLRDLLFFLCSCQHDCLTPCGSSRSPPER